ncbi:MAG: DNA-methyltransferase [Actinomycetota bacterium]
MSRGSGRALAEPPPRNTILVGDARERLAELPSGFIDCVITSPPYFQLRDYGVTGQIGLEPHVEAWVAELVAVCRQIARVLKPSGSLWLNLGDSYSRHMRYGAPPKSCLLGPERLLLALSAEGWIVRNKVIWAKANPMPTSVGDRLSATYDFVYFLVRDRRYYFDLDTIREPHRSAVTVPRKKLWVRQERPEWAGPLAGSNDGLERIKASGLPGHPLGKNPGDVWRLTTVGYRGAHFATFPESLVERPLLATCPEALCVACGRAWRRQVSVKRVGEAGRGPRRADDPCVRRYPKRWETERQLGLLVPGCLCEAGVRPGLALDPFFGTGTVGVVAKRHGRDWLGIELNHKYVVMAEERIRGSAKRLKAA